MSGTELVRREATEMVQYNEDQINLIKRTVCKGSTDDEFALFMEVCKSTGLNPFIKQIHAVKRWNSADQRNEMAIQTGIDGFRLIAQRSGRYNGMTAPEWYDAQKKEWVDVWVVENRPPAAARIGVYIIGAEEPTYGVAMFHEYKQTKKDGSLNSMWRTMGANQLAKCAEGQALRKAFPAELAGVYTDDEMGQADNVPPTIQQPRRASEPTPEAKALAEGTTQTVVDPKAQAEEGFWTGAITATGIAAKSKPGADPWTMYLIKGNDGAEFVTFSESFFKEAGQHKDDGVVVQIEYNREERGGRVSLKIVTMEQVKA